MALIARYPGTCAVCRRPFPEGASIDWDRQTKRARHAACAPEVATAVAASRAVDADVAIPAPEGLTYLPFQRAGIVFCLDRFGYNWGQGEGSATRRLSTAAGAAQGGQGESRQGTYAGGTSEGGGLDPSHRADARVAAQGQRSNAGGHAAPSGPASSSQGPSRETEGLGTELAGGERPTPNTASRDGGGAPQAHRVRPRISDPDAGTRNIASTPEALQGGLRQSSDEDRRGARRTIPSTETEAPGGPAENRNLDSTRMAGHSSRAREGGDAIPSRGGAALIADEMG